MWSYVYDISFTAIMWLYMYMTLYMDVQFPNKRECEDWLCLAFVARWFVHLYSSHRDFKFNPRHKSVIFILFLLNVYNVVMLFFMHTLSWESQKKWPRSVAHTVRCSPSPTSGSVLNWTQRSNPRKQTWTNYWKWSCKQRLKRHVIPSSVISRDCCSR